MRLPEKKDKRSAMDKEIDRLLKRMSEIEDQTSEEYQSCQASLNELVVIKGRSMPKDDNRRRLDPNTIWTTVFSLIELGAIMNYEQLRVITTKAFGRMIRPRL